MNIRLTTLCENTAIIGDIQAEWGNSILIEADGMNILFDTGKTTAVSYNADSLGVDLNKIDKIVLSHSHYDHTGGLRQLLVRMKKEVEIIAHPDVWKEKHCRRIKEDKFNKITPFQRAEQDDRYSGIPFQRYELESLGARFTLSTKPVKITDNIMTTGEIPMLTEYEKVDLNMFVKEEGKWVSDMLLDDLALVINTRAGLVVILGCAHRGIINTLYHAQKLSGNKQIYMVVGGAHLISSTKESVGRVIADLKALDVKRLGLCHCTGLPATMLIAQAFGDKFFFNNAGNVLELN